MIIFLYGNDNYRSGRKLNEIVERYKEIHKKGLSLRFFEEKNIDFQDFKNEIEASSIFKEKKLVVLKDGFFNKEFQKEFLKEKEKFVNSDNIVLIYEKKGIDKKSSFLKFLKKKASFKKKSVLEQEFEPLEGQKLENWIKKEFKKYQTLIDPEALEGLVNFVGNNLWQMENEIKKLVNYKRDSFSPKSSSDERKIEAKDVKLLIKPKIETDIFKTIDAVSENKKDKALAFIHFHLEKGDSPLYLLTMINFQFRNLIIIKDLIEKNTPYYKIIGKSKLHPFVVRKSYQQAQNFTLQKLKKIYLKIFETDFRIKTGKIEPEAALDMLIAGI